MRTLVPALLLAALISGCALTSEQERESFRAMERLEAEHYRGAAERATATGAARPEAEVEPLPEDASLADVLAEALRRNAGLEAAFHRWKAALYRVPQARSLPQPRVSYAYYLREIETRTGPQQQRFGLSQAFPWFGTLQRRAEVAMAEATTAERQFEAAKLDLFLRVKRAYYEYAYLGRAIAITKETIALVKDLEEIARTRYKANLAGHPDVIRAQVELGKLEDRVRTLRDRERPLRARLNAAMNRPPDAPLPPPTLPATPGPAFSGAPVSEVPVSEVPVFEVPVFEADARTWLVEHNPVLGSIDARIAREQAAIELERQAYYPEFALSAEYIDTDSAIMPNTPDSSDDPIIVGISLTFPLWFHRVDAAVAEARSRFARWRAERIERENTLRSDLELAFYRYRDAGRKIALYRDTLIPKAEQSLGATQEAYVGERVGFLDVIDAERVLLEFRLARDRAAADRAIGFAEIEKLVGREIPRPGPAGERKETP